MPLNGFHLFPRMWRDAYYIFEFSIDVNRIDKGFSGSVAPLYSIMLSQHICHASHNLFATEYIYICGYLYGCAPKMARLWNVSKWCVCLWTYMNACISLLFHYDYNYYYHRIFHHLSVFVRRKHTRNISCHRHPDYYVYVCSNRTRKHGKECFENCIHLYSYIRVIIIIICLMYVIFIKQTDNDTYICIYIFRMQTFVTYIQYNVLYYSNGANRSNSRNVAKVFARCCGCLRVYTNLYGTWHMAPHYCYHYHHQYCFGGTSVLRNARYRQIIMIVII